MEFIWPAHLGHGPWSEVITMLESKKADMATTALSVTAERTDIIEFTRSLELDIDTLTMAREEERQKVRLKKIVRVRVRRLTLVFS